MSARRYFWLGVVFAVFSPPGAARAEVLSSASGGFITKNTVTVGATRADVYRAFVNDIGKWWNDERTVSGNAGSLYIDARALGCFCEVLGADAGFVHFTVTFVNPQVMLRLTGGLGPLGLMGAAGNMTVEFTDTDEGTDVVIEYAVGGYAPNGLDELAPEVDSVLQDAAMRLKAYVEQGEPVGD